MPTDSNCIYWLMMQLARVYDEVERDFHILGATAVEDRYVSRNYIWCNL